MRIRHLAAVAATAVLLTACGGSGNGEAAKKGPQVAADAAQALEQAGAARLTGSGTMDGRRMRVDLHLQADGATGTMTIDGRSVLLTNVGGKVYMKAPAAFWQGSGVPASLAQGLGSKWVILPSGASSGLDQFTLHGMAQQLRKPSGAKIEDAVHTATLHGQEVVVVTQSDGSTLDVAATGKPYPLQTVDKGKDSGTITISDFGRKTEITAPSGAVDLSQLGS